MKPCTPRMHTGKGHQHKRRDRHEKETLLAGLDSQYGRWDELLRDIFNVKLKVVQNRKKAESDTKENDDNENDEELQEVIGTP